MTFLEYLAQRARANRKRTTPNPSTAPQRVVKPISAAPGRTGLPDNVRVTDWKPGMEPPKARAKPVAPRPQRPPLAGTSVELPGAPYDVLPVDGKRPMQLARKPKCRCLRCRLIPDMPPVIKLAKRDTTRVPTGANELFSQSIHPAFRGTSLAFHTVAMLKKLRGVARSGDTSLSPHAAPHAMTRIVKGILQGRKTVEDFYGEKVNPFKAIGEWFKKLRGDGLGSIPKHLEDYADRYNVDTADRRHRLDREVYDLIHDVHGQGDHERTDLKLRDIARRLKGASEEQKRQLTGAVRQHLQQRVKATDLPGDWHNELLNSMDRLHQYSLDRQMLKEDAQAQRRSRIVGPEPKQPGQIGWREWFMGAKSNVGRRQDPLRLSRPDASTVHTIARLVHAGDESVTPGILHDVLMDHGDMHHDEETMAHLHSAGDRRVSTAIHPVTGRVWARQHPDTVWTALNDPNDHDRTNEVGHTAHGPGGLFITTRHRRLASNPVRFVYRLGDVQSPGYHPYRRGTIMGAPHYAPDIAAREADRLASTFPEEEPVRLNRLSSGLPHALRELASRNQKAREEVARRLIRESGEQGTVTSVLAHHPELGFRASVLAALATDDSYARDASKYLGAWHGMLTQEPETVAFHAHEGGTDRLHVLHTSAQPEETTRVLQAAGISRFALRPHAAGSTAFVYDGGGLHDLTPLASRLPNGSATFTSGTGQRLGQGAGADAGAGATPAAAYRDHIRSVESPAAPEAQRVHLARLKPGAIRAKDMRVWQAVVAKMPEDRVRRGAFADWLEEKGHHHSDEDLRRLREHEGPLFATRHPVSKKVVAVPGSPESVESVNERRIAHGLVPMYSDRTKLFHGPTGVTAVYRIAGAEPNDATVGVMSNPETGSFDWSREWTAPQEAHHTAQRHAFGD